MERIGIVHEQEQVGRRERAKETISRIRSGVRGQGGIRWTTTAEIKLAPRANRLHQRLLLIFSLAVPSLSHWPLACHTGNYLLNTPGSNSFCVYAHSYHTANTLCLRGVSSLPTWLGHLGLYAHDYSAHTQTQTQIQTPCIITMCQLPFDSHYQSNSVINNNTNSLPLFLSHGIFLLIFL